MVTFGDFSLAISQYRNYLEAKNTGVFKHIFTYNEGSLPLKFWDEFRDLVYIPREKLPEAYTEENHKYSVEGRREDREIPLIGTMRGLDIVDGEHDFNAKTIFNKDSSVREFPTFLFGYAVWKPYIIAEVLKQIPEGAYLLYLDCGFRIINPNRFKEHIQELKELSDGEIPVVTVFNSFKIGTHCPKELFDFYEVDYKKYKNSPSFASGAVMLRNCPEARETVELWLKVYREAPELIYTKKRTLHDQTILSLLGKKGLVVAADNDKFYKNFGYEDIINPEKSKVGMTYSRDKVYMPIELQSMELFHLLVTEHRARYNKYGDARYNTSEIDCFLQFKYKEQYEELLERHGGMMTGAEISDETLEKLKDIKDLYKQASQIY